MAKSLEKLKKKQTEVVQDLRGLQDKADKEEREMSAEEQTQFTELESEFDRLGESIKRELKLSKFEEETRDDDEPEYESRGKGKSGGNDRSEERGGNKAERGAGGPFGSFGEQLMAVYYASDPEHRSNVDKRLFEVRAPTGMNETIPSDGGFLVQKDFQNELLKRTYETGLLAGRCRRIPISGRSNGIRFNVLDETSRANGSRFGGLNLFWTGEAEQKQRSKPKLRQIEMTLKKLTGMLYCTDELLEDTTALEGWVREAFSDEFGFKIDDAIIRGTGSGMPLGILNSPGRVTTPKESGQTADTINYLNIINMYSRLWSPSLRNAVWLYNTEIFPQLATMSFATGGTALPVFMPANNISGQPFPTLMGLPMLPLEQSAALGDEGDIMLVDLKEYLLIDKGGIQVASSIHVRFDYDETAFRFVYRVDGQPIWNNVITPFKGTMTKAPFVTLEAR